MTRQLDTDAVATTPSDTDADTLVEMCGETQRALSRADLDALPTVEREVTVVCATGDRTTATWTGVPLADLLSTVDVPATTTHLRVTSDDGYRACLDVRAALDGVLALARDGESLGDVEAYETRVVAPGIDGERLVKGVTRIESLVLAPDEEPSDHETLSLDSPLYG